MVSVVYPLEIFTKTRPCVEKKEEKKPLEQCSVGDRVLFKSLFNNPGNWGPGDEIAGTVISMFTDTRRVYWIELDALWSDRVSPHHHGKKIIVGNIRGGLLFRLTE
jgi:hypothetical protein